MLGRANPAKTAEKPKSGNRKDDTEGVDVSERQHPQAASDESYDGAERRSEVPVIDASEIDYFPMFWASVQAAAITLLLQFSIPIYVALQRDITIELRLWNNFLPYFGLGTDYESYMNIVFWSSIGTSVVLGFFSIYALLFRDSLRVKTGRLFAWLDISLIGFLLLNQHNFFGTTADSRPFMWVLLLAGLCGFVIGSVFIWDEDRRRDYV